MATHTTWSRLEPRTRNPELAGGVAAPVHDPLWLLGRQRQLGELRAEDAGSPVSAHVTGESRILSVYRPGDADDGGETVPYDPTTSPLDAVVEREPRRRDDAGGGRERRAATSGAHLLRVLAAHGVSVSADQFPARARVDRLDAVETVRDADAEQYLGVLGGRAVDGDVVAAAASAAANGDGSYDASDLPLPAAALPDPEIDSTVAAGTPLADALDEYGEWYAAAYGTPDVDGQPTSDASENAASHAWDDERLGYSFAVGARDGDGGDRTLTADSYHGDGLDWYAFDASDEPLATTLSAPDDAATPVEETVVPTRASFPGMPRARWWELEDGDVDVGLFDPGVTDLGRLVASEFLLVGGDDWFSLPVATPVGSTLAIDRVEVTDTFGESSTLGAVGSGVSGGDGWHWLSHTDGSGGDPVTTVAPTTVGALAGPTVEDVGFVRDETANLAWGVERVAEACDGGPLDRTAAVRLPGDDDPGVPQTPAQTSAGAARYRLGTDVPPYWIPFVAERLLTADFDPTDPTTDAEMRFQVARLLLDGDSPDPPLGTILAAEDLTLAEAAVSRSGTTVDRARSLARWQDGSTHAWSRRRRRPGDRESSSGLAFDAVERDE